jgi:hypothetical protein
VSAGGIRRANAFRQLQPLVPGLVGIGRRLSPHWTLSRYRWRATAPACAAASATAAARVRLIAASARSECRATNRQPRRTATSVVGAIAAASRSSGALPTCRRSLSVWRYTWAAAISARTSSSCGAPRRSGGRLESFAAGIPALRGEGQLARCARPRRRIGRGERRRGLTPSRASRALRPMGDRRTECAARAEASSWDGEVHERHLRRGVPRQLVTGLLLTRLNSAMA